MVIRGEQNWRIAQELALGLKPEQTITNDDLVEALGKEDPRHKGKRGRIIAADQAANSTSGYNIPPVPGESEWGRSYPAVLFQLEERNKYVKYDPSLHGFWTCLNIHGEKTAVGILIKIRIR